MATEKAYSAEMNAIKGDVKQLREDVASLIGALGEDASKQGKKARDDAMRRLKDARAKGEDSLRDVESAIERNPLTALLTALGIGFLIGALLNRR